MSGSSSRSKICFVIAPIGAEGSEARLRSDQVLKHIITPAANECGYEPLRADQISEPGLITSQVIQHIVEDPLVIADLTSRNPNVFYELAVRHAIKKPVVQIIHATESIPFDVAGSRTIHVDHHDLDSAARAKDEITKQIRSVEKNPTDVDTPISVAIELQSLRQSDNPIEKSNAEIITMLQDLRQDFRGALEAQERRSRLHPALLDDLLEMMGRYRSLVEADAAPHVPPDRADRLRIFGDRTERLLEMLCREAGVPSPAIRRRLRRAEPPADKPTEE